MATQKGRNWSSGDIVTAANLSSVERGVSAVSSLYEPTTWANGDTVTAAALNNIEQGIVNADGGGKTWVTLCEEEVTTVQNGDFAYGDLSYSQLIDTDTIRVTFNGTEYICNKRMSDEYGAAYDDDTSTFDWSEYPFNIFSDTPNQLATETSGTYQVKIEALQSGGSSDFSTAQVTVNYNFTQLPEDDEPLITIEGASIYDENFSELTGIFKNNDKWEREDYHIISTNSNSYDVEVLFLYANNKHVTLHPAFDATIAVSGNATVVLPIEDNPPVVDITGDCTITISGESSGDDPIK